MTFRLSHLAIFAILVFASCTKSDSNRPTVERSPPSIDIRVPQDPTSSLEILQSSGARLGTDVNGYIVEVDFRSTEVTHEYLEELSKLVKPKRIDLRECTLSNDEVKLLGKLSTLESLRFSNRNGNTTIDDDAMVELGKLTKLRLLALDYVWISEKGIEHLQNLKSLQELYLAQTLVGDEALALLPQFPALKKLRLASTSVTGAGLQHLPKLDQLEDVDLSECSQLTDEGMIHLGHIDSLQRLNLWRVQITDDGAKELAPLTNLKWLNLDNTQITNDALPALSGMTSLTFLHLGSTKVTDGGLSALENLKSLKDLKLTRTSVSEEGVAKLQEKLPETEIQLKYLGDESQ